MPPLRPALSFAGAGGYARSSGSRRRRCRDGRRSCGRRQQCREPQQHECRGSRRRRRQGGAGGGRGAGCGSAGPACQEGHQGAAAEVQQRQGGRGAWGGMARLCEACCGAWGQSPVACYRILLLHSLLCCPPCLCPPQNLLVMRLQRLGDEGEGERREVRSCCLACAGHVGTARACPGHWSRHSCPTSLPAAHTWREPL